MANLWELFVSVKADPKDLTRLGSDIKAVAKNASDDFAKNALKVKLDDREARAEFAKFIAEVKSKGKAEVEIATARAKADLEDLLKRKKLLTDKEAKIKIAVDIGRTKDEIAALQKAKKELEASSKESFSPGNIKSTLGTIAGALGAAFVFEQTKAVQEYRLSLRLLIKDTELYNTTLAQTKAIADLLWQSEAEVGKFVQSLIAYGIQIEKIPQLLRNIQDVTAASGKGEEGFRRIALAIGQIQASGILAKQDLNQLNEVFPASQILIEKLHLTADQVRNIGDQAIPSEVAIAALMQGISERYGGAAENRLQSLGGSMDQLTGSTKTLAAAIGGELSQGTSFALQVMKNFVKFVGSVFIGLIKLVKTVGFSISGVFQGVFFGIVNVVGNAFSLIIRLGKALITDFKGVGAGIAEAFLDGIVKMVNSASEKIDEFAQSIAKKLGIDLPPLKFKIENPLKGAGGESTALIKEIASFGADAGKTFGQTFVNNSTAGFELAAEEFKGIFAQAEKVKVASGGISPEQQALIDAFLKDGWKKPPKGGAGAAQKEVKKSIEEVKGAYEALDRAQDRLASASESRDKAQKERNTALRIGLENIAKEAEKVKKEYLKTIDEIDKKRREQNATDVAATAKDAFRDVQSAQNALDAVEDQKRRIFVGKNLNDVQTAPVDQQQALFASITAARVKLQTDISDKEKEELKNQIARNQNTLEEISSREDLTDTTRELLKLNTDEFTAKESLRGAQEILNALKNSELLAQKGLNTELEKTLTLETSRAKLTPWQLRVAELWDKLDKTDKDAEEKRGIATKKQDDELAKLKEQERIYRFFESLKDRPKPFTEAEQKRLTKKDEFSNLSQEGKTLFDQLSKKQIEVQGKKDIETRAIQEVADFATRLNNQVSETSVAAIQRLKSEYGDLITQINNAIKANQDLIASQAAVSRASSRSGSAKGFMAGGYTGEGAVDEVAGIVHKGEYVIPQHIVARVPDMVHSIEAMRNGNQSYDHSRNLTISGPISVQSQSDLEMMLDRYKWRL